MNSGDHAIIQERKWRVRVAGSLLALVVWGWGMSGAGFLLFGTRTGDMLAGLALLVLLACGLGYYFGSGVGRISSLPSPEPRIAAKVGRALLWVFPFLLVMGVIGLVPLIFGWYRVFPSPRREIDTIATIVVLSLLILLGIVFQRWRSILIKIGESGVRTDS